MADNLFVKGEVASADKFNAFATELEGYKDDAAASAAQSENYALNAAEFGDNKYTFADTTTGISGTTNGQYFRVPQGVGNVLAFRYYKNNAGVAQEVAEYPGQGSITNSIREYATLSVAQSDVSAGNILNNAYCLVRNTDNSTISDEYQNLSGVLTATGKQIPSKGYVDGTITQGPDTSSLVSFADGDGFIGAKVLANDKGVGFSSSAVNILPELLSNLLFSFFKVTNDGFSIQDEDGRILASFNNGVAKGLGVTVKYDWLQQIVSMLGNNIGIESSAIRFYVDGNSSDIITMQDPDGIVFLRLTKDFKLQTKIRVDGEISGTDGVARIANNSISLVAGAMRQRYYLTQMPTADINIYIVYGQSFSVGTNSQVPLSVLNMFGNLMLGNSPRGSNYVSGTTSDQFGPVGNSNLNNLIEVRQLDDGTLSPSSGSFGETPLSGWLNFGKLLHNQRLMVDNDSTRIFAGACCGVGGKTIAQLSKGATPNFYNHVITALQAIKAAADAAGKTSRFCGFMWMQGENDGSTAYDAYMTALNTLYNNICTDGMAIFGQTLPPHWYNYQLGGTYTSDSNSMAVSRALLDFCDNNPGLATFVNPVGHLPKPVNPDGNDNHMFANSYRWFGCDAGKVMDLVQRGCGRPVFRMREAIFSEDTVNIAFSVPVPPVKFTPGYVGNVATSFADKGFTIKDAQGVLHGSDLTVTLASDVVVKIVASRKLVAPVSIWLGDKTYHSGVHNIADSDDSLSTYKWELVTGSPAAESISELNGKPYALQNWCGADIITATEEA
ncbi:TPA: sialate O-acetylesterase [Klebsiella quasipneumoniae subsp. similipneumoniae]